VPDAFASWIERDVVRAAGPDTTTFLQGQLSQDVATLADGASTWSLLLAPTGKVEAWLRVTRVNAEDVVLDVEGGWGDAVIERLARFKLRTKCDLGRVTGWRCLAVRGTTVASALARPIVWPGTVGVDLLGEDVAVPPGVDLRDDYERSRIRAGVPAMGRELTDATIPVEAGQWLIDASVSFTKGCYTGQELVARIDSRGGNAPRPVRGLRVDGQVEVGAAVTFAGKDAGVVTSAFHEKVGDVTIALAPLLRAVEPGASVVVAGHAGEVTPLPMP
jgi:folate-binding protein YgfZ